MINNKDEYLTALKTLIGERTDDEALAVLEYANKIDSDKETKITELNKKIEELETEKTNLDTEWRNRYRDTFFNPQKLPDESKDVSRETNENAEQGEDYPQTYDDLFKEIN